MHIHICIFKVVCIHHFWTQLTKFCSACIVGYRYNVVKRWWIYHYTEYHSTVIEVPDNKVHWANMGPTLYLELWGVFVSTPHCAWETHMYIQTWQIICFYMSSIMNSYDGLGFNMFSQFIFDTKNGNICNKSIAWMRVSLKCHTSLSIIIHVANVSLITCENT